MSLLLLPMLLGAASPPAPRVVKPFSLKAADGAEWSFAGAMKGKKALAVVFLGTECPVNNQYLPELARLAKRYESKVSFVAVNSNAHDTPTRLLAHAKANKLPFPVLKDPANVVADAFGARRTPEAFVVSPEGTIFYQGRIDDQIGIGFRRKEPTRRDLAQALDEALAGKRVSLSFTEAPGCLIARAIEAKADGKITWTRHVERIVQNRCQECHRAGQVGPMPLTSYEDAVSWSGMIAEVLREDRMPPWHADPRHGSFANDRSIPKAEKDTILAWIKDRCPKGEAKDAPGPKAFADGWGIGKPDEVFQMPKAFEVPAEMPAKGVRYQYFRVPTSYKEDRWIQAAEARPGAREVVHHILVYVIDPKDPRNRPGRGVDGIGNGLLTTYAPGDSPLILEPGQAKRLPKGSMLVFQMHYTPDGVARKDRSSVGIVWAKEKPRTEVKTRAVAQQGLMIWPGDSNSKAVSSARFDKETELLALFPHMHVRGKDFKYEIKRPGEKAETILSVPRYDFNWQSNYRLAKPLKLPAGTTLACTAHFDNSTGNPNNPDPKKFVFWGDQTWQEMMIGFVDYTVPLK
ncbi:MAG: redoxin domain-containing protein [Gemmataceae bacterium]|nr:redoxin domain-containing protein [Gemmataceae bacterium]